MLPKLSGNSVFSKPSRLRAIRYSNGSHMCSLTNCVSASLGYISGNSCLNIKVQEGTALKMA